MEKAVESHRMRLIGCETCDKLYKNVLLCRRNVEKAEEKICPHKKIIWMDY